MAAVQSRAKLVRTGGTVRDIARERDEHRRPEQVTVRGRVPVAAAIALAWAGAGVLRLAERWAAHRERVR
jgi:hypothetical protein